MNNKPGYRFRTGEDVAHKDNLTVKMQVVKILRQARRIEHLTEEERIQVLQRDGVGNSFIAGIECHWWDPTNKFNLKEGKFHSRELVPWHVAQSGPKLVEEWINDIRKH